MTKPTYPAARRLDLHRVASCGGADVRRPRPLPLARGPGHGGVGEAGSRRKTHSRPSSCQALPGRAELRARLTSLMAAGVVTAPAWRGERQFFMRRTADQEHAVLVTVDPDGAQRILLDPMQLDPAGTTTLDAWQPSKEGDLLAYQISEGGDEESILRVIDVETGEVVDGPIDRCRYSPVGWLPGAQAYYYVRRLPAFAGAGGRGAVSPPGVVAPRRHRPRHRRVRVRRRLRQDDVLLRVGQPRRALADRERLARYRPAQRSVDRRPHDVATRQSPDLQELQVGVDAQTSVHVGRDGRAYIYTDRDAPRGRLVVTTPDDPGPETWRDLLPEDPEAVLEDFAILDGDELRAAGPARVVDPSCSERTHAARPGDRASASVRYRCRVLARSVACPSVPTAAPTAGSGTPTTRRRRVSSASTRAPARPVAWASAPGTVEVPTVHARLVTYTSRDGTPVRMIVVSTRPTPNPITLGRRFSAATEVSVHR